MSKNNIDW